MMTFRGVLGLTSGLVVFGSVLCGCGATEDQLRARAAFDLSCGQDQLTIVEIDNRTSGVRGCGQHATYVEQCAQGNANCTWVLNSDSKPSGKSADSQ